MRSLAMVSLVALAMPLEAQRFDTLVKNVGAPRHAGIGRLIPELTIGGADATADEYLFESIGHLLATKDGTLWVIDGRTKRTVRRYDQSGTFIRNVGRRGDGPGEWQSPDMFAQFRDGRVILRDAVVGRPLTLFKPNGDYDTTWAFQTSTTWSLHADTSDAIWLRLQAGVALRSSSPVVTIRLRTNGTVIDTVPEPPPLPPFTLSSFRVSSPNGPSSVYTAPYQLRGVGAWSPDGYHARGVSTRYAIDLLLPRTLPNGGSRPWRAGDRVVSIRNKFTPVPVTDAERDDQTAYMNAQVSAFGGTLLGPMPRVPREKPPLRSIAFDIDGRIWAKVSQPSERYEPPPGELPRGRPAPPVPKWREPTVYDVFEPSGAYIGRVATPYDVQLTGRSGAGIIQARGDVVWGIVRDEDGVESIRRFRIAWGGSR